MHGRHSISHVNESCLRTNALFNEDPTLETPSSRQKIELISIAVLRRPKGRLRLQSDENSDLQHKLEHRDQYQPPASAATDH
jgi:hypothetical protein